MSVGIGCTIIDTPILNLLSQYFRRRRVLACGIGFSGSSVGGLVLPPIITLFISLYSIRGALLLLGGLWLNVLVVGAIMRPLPLTDLSMEKDDFIIEVVEDVVKQEVKNKITTSEVVGIGTCLEGNNVGSEMKISCHDNRNVEHSQDRETHKTLLMTDEKDLQTLDQHIKAEIRLVNIQISPWCLDGIRDYMIFVHTKASMFNVHLHLCQFLLLQPVLHPATSSGRMWHEQI